MFDDEGRALCGASSGRPGIHFLGWDTALVRRFNITDMNVLAHRRCEARFDEALAYMADWDLLLQLSRDSEPVEVPAVAAYYRTDVAGRITTALTREEIDREYQRIQAKFGEQAAA